MTCSACNHEIVVSTQKMWWCDRLLHRARELTLHNIQVETCVCGSSPVLSNLNQLMKQLQMHPKVKNFVFNQERRVWSPVYVGRRA